MELVVIHLLSWNSGSKGLLSSRWLEVLVKRFCCEMLRAWNGCVCCYSSWSCNTAVSRVLTEGHVLINNCLIILPFCKI